MAGLALTGATSFHVSTIHVTRRIKRDAKTVWQTLADFQGISKFNPFLKHSRLLDEHPGACGVGTRRQCDLRFGKTFLREKVIDWQEGRSYTVHIYESILPLKSLYTTIGITPIGESESDVYMKAEYEPKFYAVGKLFDVVLLRWMMRVMFGGVLKGLDSYVSHRAD